MMKIRVWIFLCLASLTTFAQVKPIYFYGNKIIADSTKATSYAVYGKLSSENVWVFKRYDLYNNLMQTGAYADSLLTIAQGKFDFYNYIADFNADNYENFKLKGNIIYKTQTGNFVNGMEEGKWLSFYPDGNILTLQNFEGGKANGKFISYNKYGKTMIEGTYKEGKMDGEWVFAKEKRKIVYHMDAIVSSTPIIKNK